MHLILQLLNGLSFGMLIFLASAGFTLVLGIMKIANLAQGSFYLLGAYSGLMLANYTGNFGASLAGGIASAFVGFLVYIFLLRPHVRTDVNGQVLATFGVMFIMSDFMLMIWGPMLFIIPKPGLLSGSITIGEFSYPVYRSALILIGIGIMIFLEWFMERTKYGAITRAGIDNEKMAEALGINIPRLVTLMFTLGAGLTGLAGVLGGPIIGACYNLDMEILMLILIVVIVVGMGSLKGAFVASLLVGLLDSFGRIFFPEFAMFTLFVPAVIVMAIKPEGLFGRK